MEKRHIGFDLIVYADPSGLPQEDQELLRAAREATSGSYSPYSRFRVGAALRLATGETVIGSNQENASFPSGLCAERVAVFQAGARFPGAEILALAIYASAPDGKPHPPAAPCGNCRQSLLEYEHRQESPIRILLHAGREVYECPSVGAVLPLGFDPGFLS
ncbi:cytidine deaminase [Robiginitalea sp. SC105]|uniref:cytidine deaminase n=1 Tax=Robiginitalea sp. SC105 TaxID=2762332 RepID=UPI00163B19AD|nr:cytidine deaminase [Robiginitalea sp. SC105]MBC2839574.1 cytidine deaminase [Robiginitalea sp. SC105]